MNHVIMRVFNKSFDNLCLCFWEISSLSTKSSSFWKEQQRINRQFDGRKKTGNSAEERKQAILRKWHFFFMQNRSAIKFLADKNDTFSLNISSEKSYIVQKIKKTANITQSVQAAKTRKEINEQDLTLLQRSVFASEMKCMPDCGFVCMCVTWCHEISTYYGWNGNSEKTNKKKH